MENNVEKLIKLPFRIAQAVSRPVADLIEDTIGKDVDRFIEMIPGGKAINHATSGFNHWLAQDSGKNLPDAKEEKKDEEIVEPR